MAGRVGGADNGRKGDEGKGVRKKLPNFHSF